jgi:hypothetical protein
MKYKNIITTAILAFAGVALVSTSAQATLSVQDGEVLLGFSNATGTQDYLLKVGAIPGVTIGGDTTLDHTFTIGNFSADLSAVFGSTWYTAATGGALTFTAFGTDQNGTYTSNGNPGIYIGRTTVTAGATISSGVVNNLFSNINNVTGDYNGAAGNASAANGLKESTTISLSNPNPFASYMAGGANTHAPNAWDATLATGVQSAINANSYLNIYTVANSGSAPTATETGYFAVASNGDISYNVASVPEPSTYAMLGIGALFMGVVIRRKIKASNA